MLKLILTNYNDVERTGVKQKHAKADKQIDKRATSVKKEHPQSQLLVVKAAGLNSSNL